MDHDSESNDGPIRSVIVVNDHQSDMRHAKEHTKPKILMIISLFHPFAGGAEKSCQQLCNGLMGQGFSVALLTQRSEGLPEYEVVDGIPVYREIKGWHLFELTYMLSVLYFLLKHRREYDIIHCFGIYLFVPPALLMKYLFGKKVILRLLCSGQFGDFWRVDQLKWKKVVMGSSRRMDRIVFLSNDIKRELIENRFPVQILAHISNGVDVERFKPQTENRHCHFKNICFVGRLEEQKGVDYLMRAVAAIQEKGNDIRLFIVGDGRLSAALKNLCKVLKLDDRVVFTGHAQDVLPYYQDADVFVLPSVSEGMSVALLEAMACGLPVVATCAGGNADLLDPDLKNKEIVSNYHIGANGILVRPKDDAGLAEAILELLNDTDLSRQLGEKARRAVKENYSQKKIMNEYTDLYDSLS